jgi:hypothetical protein
MNTSSLLSALSACVLLPATAWAQSYGSSTPPPLPTPAVAPASPGFAAPPSYGAPPGYPTEALPPGQPMPVYNGPPPANSGPLFSSPPANSFPQNYVQGPTYVPPPTYLPAPGPTYVPPPSTIYAPQPAPDLTVPTSFDGARWMFSAEALWLERVDNRDTFLGNTVTNFGGPNYIVDTLTSGDQDFPFAPGIKLQLGYRFSDANAIEVAYFGLQQWSVSRAIQGDPIGDTVLAFSPWTQTDALIGGFDNHLGYTYKSSTNSVEVNDRIFGNGGPYWSFNGIVGLRYVQVSDKFNLNGADDFTGAYENIDIKTSNNLLGPQVGIDLIRNWGRWEFSTGIKAAIFANFNRESYSNLNSSGVTTGNPAGLVPISTSATNTDVAGLFEFSFILRYRMTDYLWLRGGYQNYYLGGLALGPRQLGGPSRSGGMDLDGPSLGLEAHF